MCVCLCGFDHSAIPHTVIWWRAPASKRFKCVCAYVCVHVCTCVWSPMMLWSSTSAALTQTHRPGNLHNKSNLESASCRHDEDNEFFAFCKGLFLSRWIAENLFFVLFFQEEEGEKKERSDDWMNEFSGHKWFIAERERERESQREWVREAAFQSLSLISKMGLEISSLTEPK